MKMSMAERVCIEPNQVSYSIHIILNNNISIVLLAMHGKSTIDIDSGK